MQPTSKFATFAITIAAALTLTAASKVFAADYSDDVIISEVQPTTEDQMAEMNDDSTDMSAAPYSRGVQCRAVNGRGLAFYGQGRNLPVARDRAL